MASTSETSEEVFVLVDRQEAAAAPAAGWGTPRRSRLAGLLRPWRHTPGALPPGAPAPRPSPPLSAIPILSLPPSSGAPSHSHTTHINPLTAQPLGSQLAAQDMAGPAGQHRQAQPLLLYGCSSAELDSHAACSYWLQQLPDPEALRPPSPGTADEADSLPSGMSVCSSSTEGGRGGGGGGPGGASSFARLRLPRPYEMSSDGSGHSSNSNLLNLLMQQGEPGVVGGQQDCSPAARAAMPSLADTAAAAAVAAPVGPQQPADAAADAGSCTANPMLEQRLPPVPPVGVQQQEAALLSWRRHAWQYNERQEPELLRRLLAHNCGEEHPADSAQPLSPSAVGGPPASSGRGRASRRHLLALTAALAAMVLLLHALHSRALLEEQLAGEQQQEQKKQQLVALQAAVVEAAAAESAVGWGNVEELEGSAAVPGPRSTQALGRRHGPHQHKHYTHGGASAGRLPRLHLRRRLTLLLFTQRFDGRASGGAALGSVPGTSSNEQHVLFGRIEEWEVTLGRK